MMTLDHDNFDQWMTENDIVSLMTLDNDYWHRIMMMTLDDDHDLGLR